MKLLEGNFCGLPRSVPAAYILCVAALWSIFVVFTLGLGHEVRIKYEMMYYAGDAALMAAPALLLPRRWRMVMLLPVALTALYLMASQAYFQYWHDTLPLDLVFRSASWNGFVADAAGSLFGATQWAILLITAAYGVGLWLTGRKRAGGYCLRGRLLWLAGAAGFYILTFAGWMYQRRNYLQSIGEDPSFAELMSMKFSDGESTNGGKFDQSSLIYSCFEISKIGGGVDFLELDDEEDLFIERTIGEGSTMSGIVSKNEQKNLIFIIVESLNADMIRINYGGRSVTPVIDSLLADSTTFAALNVRVQVGAGGSSDGQMIYNTGLLPVFGNSTAMTYGGNRTFPSLAKSLPVADAQEFIVEGGEVWNHFVTSAAYGYSSLNDSHSIAALGIDVTETGQDRAVFEMALRLMPGMRQPFLAEIVTLSMHYPFIDEGAPRRSWIDSLPDIPTLERNFLQTLNYFDGELGRFLEGLKAEGLYDNSLIVLASDHDQAYKNNSRNAAERHPIAFIALNSGVGRRIERPVYQMDVYPTILDLMGWRGDGYRGMGCSLVGEDYCMTDSMAAERRRASDLIIRSDYFKEK